jgi:hypothetical protein
MVCTHSTCKEHVIVHEVIDGKLWSVTTAAEAEAKAEACSQLAAAATHQLHVCTRA